MLLTRVDAKGNKTAPENIRYEWEVPWRYFVTEKRSSTSGHPSLV